MNSTLYKVRGGHNLAFRHPTTSRWTTIFFPDSQFQLAADIAKELDKPTSRGIEKILRTLK